MSAVEGWEIFEADNLLALKSPASLPLVNFVWGEVSSERLRQVKEFFGANEFYWLLSDEQNQLIPSNLKQFFSVAEIFSEMNLDLNSFNAEVNSDHITILQAKTEHELQTWTGTAIATFGFTENSFKEFFYPLIKYAECIPFLLYYDQKAAATAMIYCGDSVAGIYAMSTKAEFRRKGLGSAAINVCVTLARQQQLEHVVLYASEDGEFLYSKLGFKSSKIWHEYYFAINFNILENS